MEAGLLNKKVAFIIQARMKSTRLPGKILMDIPLGSGKSILLWIVEELKKSKFNKDILVATSTNSENDALVLFCELNNVNCFRGNEENVLSRFIAISRQEKYDCIVRLTADNPIIDVSILDQTITNHFLEQNDYTRSQGLPIGMNFEIISPHSLFDIENYRITDSDKEHVTLFIKNNKKYKKGVFYPRVKDGFDKLRLTVDYASDYSLLSIILSQYSIRNNLTGLGLIEYIFNRYPWLFETNISNFQKTQFLNIDEEIELGREYLMKGDFKNLAKFLLDDEIVSILKKLSNQ